MRFLSIALVFRYYISSLSSNVTFDITHKLFPHFYVTYENAALGFDTRFDLYFYNCPEKISNLLEIYAIELHVSSVFFSVTKAIRPTKDKSIQLQNNETINVEVGESMFIKFYA